MFFGFGREVGDTYRYNFVLFDIPLWTLDSIHRYNFWQWIFSMGNLIAFIPFGFLYPLAQKKSSYLEFLLAFLLFIITMETLQLVTKLGIFDIEDILINTVGATIGYVTYKVCWRKGILINILSSIVIASALVIVVNELAVLANRYVFY